MAITDLGKPTSVTIVPTLLPLLMSFRLDAATAVGRSFPGQVFRHPIQSGREGVTDAVRIEPDQLSVTGIVTDYPASFLALASPIDRASKMVDTLTKMRELMQPLSVITSWTGVLENRWISEFTVSKSTGTGRALEVTMSIDKLNIVRTILVPQQLDTDIQALGMATVSVGEF